jgi:phosphate:Na+ symporter
MDATLTLIDLAGAVALLLWGVHMVQSGVQRALGPDLRHLLGRALRNRFNAFLAGLGITAILQSSTATGLMATSFTARGLVDLVPALALLLGANVGTTLIVQALSFDVSRIGPVFILTGVLLFRRDHTSPSHDLGRALIGLGLVVLALRQLLDLVTPYEDVPSLRLLLGAVATQPVVALLIGAALTWAAHSSVATVLLTMSLAAKGVVPPQAAFALTLGANLGTALNPLLEGAGRGDPGARRLPIGNLVTRIVGCAAALAALDWIGPLLVTLQPDPGRAVADFHTLFNLAVALAFFPLLQPMARLLRAWFPALPEQTDPGRPVHLDASAWELPAAALSCATREALRMADILEAMLQSTSDALLRGDRRRLGESKRLDDVLDRLNAAISTYLTALDPDSLTDIDRRRLAALLAFCTNLEHAGDVIERSLLVYANKRLKRGWRFTEEMQTRLDALLGRLTTNLRLAAGLLLSEDVRAARALAQEKEVFRDVEADAVATHFARLRKGAPQGSEADAMQLDLIRDLKRINAHLVAAAAYPILREEGALLPSRLRDSDWSG